LAAIDHDSAEQPQSTDPVELSSQIEELKGVLDKLSRERDWGAPEPSPRPPQSHGWELSLGPSIWVLGRTRLPADGCQDADYSTCPPESVMYDFLGKGDLCDPYITG
jgi:hypothetical protein